MTTRKALDRRQAAYDEYLAERGRPVSTPGREVSTEPEAIGAAVDAYRRAFEALRTAPSYSATLEAWVDVQQTIPPMFRLVCLAFSRAGLRLTHRDIWPHAEPLGRALAQGAPPDWLLDFHGLSAVKLRPFDQGCMCEQRQPEPRISDGALRRRIEELSERSG